MYDWRARAPLLRCEYQIGIVCKCMNVCVCMFEYACGEKKHYRFNCRNWKTHANLHFCRSLPFFRPTIKPTILRCNLNLFCDSTNWSKFQVHPLDFLHWWFYFFKYNNIDFVCGRAIYTDAMNLGQILSIYYYSSADYSKALDAHKLALNCTHIRFHWQASLYEWIIITSKSRRISVVKVE